MEAYNITQRPKPPPLRRSYTALPKLESPPRTTAPIQEERTSRKPHLHSIHHHHKNHHNAKDKIQSAIQLHPPSSLHDLVKHSTRSSTHSPTTSNVGSRRGSAQIAEGSIEPKAVLQPRIIRPEDVEQERQRAKAREQEILKSFDNLNDLSLTTTRNLDDTYYSLLEKVTSLRSTISKLQELSIATNELYDEFQNGANELEEDVNTQVDGFGEFKKQMAQVDALESRVLVSKDKARRLIKRLEDVQKRVEKHENAEGEWQGTITRRLRIFWSILGCAVVVFVALLIFYNFKPHSDPHSALSDQGHVHSVDLVDLSQVSIPPPVKEILQSVHAKASKESLEKPTTTAQKPNKSNASRLQIFDEL